MIRLNKIYTRTGDDGSTAFVFGRRCLKDDLCVESYGTVDEANSVIGVARLYTNRFPDLNAHQEPLRSFVLPGGKWSRWPKITAKP